MKEYDQENQLPFQTIFEQSRLGNKIIGSDLGIIQVNKAVVVMLGYSKAELEGTRILHYAHPDYVEHWHELQESLWTRRIPTFHVETVLVKKDGSTLWCSVTSILIQDAGETLGYTILEDISQRKALEEKLQKAYDAQETVMHMVAHDLKSPIHIIKTLGSFLKKEVEKLPAGAQQPSLNYITMLGDACENAYGVIKDLLLIGELESPGHTLSAETTDLKGFVASHVALFQVMAQQKGITIQVQVPVEPVLAPINQEKLARVVENLLSNAVKFTSVGGEVSVSLQQKEQKVMLKVADNGVGIPDSLQGSVFDKFTKANRKGTGGEATTGLGLFIVKQIIELHQGRIWLESKEQEGTSFYVELPAG